MSILYVDSSALVKRYLHETGSAWVIAHLDPAAGQTIFTAAITRVEVAAALAARQRSGAITLTERDDLVNLVLQHTDTQYQTVAIEADTLSRAVALTQRHRLRGYDAVQLAAALKANQALQDASLPALIFVSADDDLNSAAQGEGLSTVNPNAYP